MMDKTIILQRYTNEADIWRDAWRIVYPGAANPTAVASTLAKASSFIVQRDGTDAAKKHTALRLMCGQLASLFNVDWTGGPAELYDEVKTKVDKIERGYIDICFECGAYGDFPCRDKGINGGRLVDHEHRPHTMDRDFTDYK